MKVASQDILLNKGLDLDTHESVLPQNALAYMLNGDISGFENTGNGDFVQNTLSNKLCFTYPNGYDLLGAVRMDKGQFTVFFKTPVSSEIGIFDAETCAYVSRVNNPCLNFQNKITGTFKTLSGCDKRRVFWVEEGNPIRFIDIDECLPTKNTADCFDCDKNMVFDCDGFNLNKCVKFPQITLSEGVGNLPNGNYQIALALTDDKLRFTEYYVYPQVLKFHSNNQANNRFGVEIQFDTCPQGFDQYELVLISHRTDRGTLAQRVGYFDVEQTTFFISELDDTSYTPIDLTVLGETFPHYQSAAGLAQNNEQLLLNGVTYRDIPNYQPIANKILSKWVEFKVRAEDAKKYLSFMRGENYAFTINGVYCDNERTPEYHIPSDAEYKIKSKDGGDAVFTDLFTVVTGNDACGTDPCDTTPPVKWEVYDSSTVDPVEGAPDEGEFCVEVIEEELQTVSDFCQGQVPPLPFTRIDRVIRIKVKNQFCEEVPTTQQIEVVATFDLVNCAGTSTYPYTLYLPVGQSSMEFIYTSESMQDCGLGNCQLQTVTLSSISITESHLPECAEDYICETRTPPCGGTIGNTGDFGYWESTLQYPNNPCVWGQRTDPEADFYDPYGLSCQKVRYHRFPDNKVTHIHDDAECGEDEFVNILGVSFSNIQPFLGADGQPLDGIVGYEINVVDRRNHKSILHKGLMYNMFEEKLSDCTTSYYANYPFNDLNPDVFLSKTFARHSINPLADIFIDPSPFLEFGYTPVNTYSRSRFEYISPDVAYEQNDAGQYVQIYSEENGPVEGRFDYTEEMPKVTVLSDLAYAGVLGLMVASALLLDIDGALNAGQNALNGLVNALKPVQYGTNYWARTQYRRRNFNKVIPGNQRRKIVVGQYTIPSKMLIGENKVNNYQRESGLFLELCADINDPFVKERSRVRYKDNLCKPEFSFCEYTNFTERPVTSSYYAGVKIARPNQYGLPGSALTRTITNVIPWTNRSTTSTGLILGGDVSITKHKHIRKFPFFTALPLNLPPKTEYNTRPYMNVWHSRYWFNPGNASSVALLFPFTGASALAYTLNQHRNLEDTGTFGKVLCDNAGESCSQDNTFRVDGTFYTHVVGEIEYWCESDYIGDFREFNEIPESDIERPREDKIKYRTIQYPELHLYNRQFHWKGWSAFTPQADIDYNCCLPEKLCAVNTMAYSLKHDPLRKGDAWTKFLPNNIQQFSSKDGNLIGVKEIDDYNLLLFFTDGAYVTQQDESLVAEGSRVFLGTADAFSRRLKKISDDATGFGACIDMDSVVSTRYGVFWFDRKRKKFIHYGNQVQDASGKIQSWLNENLEGPIKGVYDNYTDNIYYTGIGKNNCPWTLSFKPKLFLSSPDRNGWVGFHSFTPEVMLGIDNTFLTGNEAGLWKHNTLYDYQRYYGQVFPFEVGSVLKANNKAILPQSLEVHAEFMKYDGFGKKRYDTKAFFDKMLVYNQLRTTGRKNIQLKDPNNTGHYGFQNSSDLIEATNTVDFTYRMNKFAVESTYQPATFLDCMEVKSTEVIDTPDQNSAPITGNWVKVHLTNEKPDYKVLLKMELGGNEELSQ